MFKDVLILLRSTYIYLLVKITNFTSSNQNCLLKMTLVCPLMNFGIDIFPILSTPLPHVLIALDVILVGNNWSIFSLSDSYHQWGELMQNWCCHVTMFWYKMWLYNFFFLFIDALQHLWSYSLTASVFRCM